MSEKLKVNRALISVFDKTGLAEFAQGLNAAGVAIVSTGSTAETIEKVGVPVTRVEDVTGFPETLDGRVKTLHPTIHAGILADRTNDEHRAQLDYLNIEAFDLVVVNLYPFAQTVENGASHDEIIEKIDIGGPSMVRAAAKNHKNVAVVVDPTSYQDIIQEINSGGFTLSDRQKLAAKAFAHTARYDHDIAGWTAEHFSADGRSWPPYVGLSLERAGELRYGENPHQSAALYVDHQTGPGIAQADQLQGKEMSYNNFVDADAAVRAAYDFEAPTVAIIKHANPCGIASASVLAQAYQKAHECDSLSAYGGVIAANRELDADTARGIKDVFTEVVVAPTFSAEALEILAAKKNLRVLELPEDFAQDKVELHQISGGMLAQVADRLDAAGDETENWTLVSGDAASEAVLADLKFAWKACRAVKSNAILLAKDEASVGIGMGQVNRVDSCELAVGRAGERAAGSVAASDAFFPFPDGLEILIKAGVKAVVQPGGSIHDDEVIKAAAEAGITMYTTGARHFYHS
ncbi:MAG: bifunctional phosphoribosylaminoimidazolecarboxamide formyltransferase/IMP cyclohydrolase [Micrococcaceae bacterium]